VNYALLDSRWQLQAFSLIKDANIGKLISSRRGTGLLAGTVLTDTNLVRSEPDACLLFSRAKIHAPFALRTRVSQLLVELLAEPAHSIFRNVRLINSLLFA